MKQVITFILPTRNRKRLVRRAIDSCLACESEIVSPSVIAIDGESDDGTLIELKNAYGDDARVQLIQNSKSTGFMNTCFQGVDLVKSKWVTFMYDDDVLSPHFVDMVNELVSAHDNFIMGYGAAYSAGEVYPFRPIAAYKRYNPVQLLLTYYGRGHDIDFKGLPQSPICCVTSIDLLHEWVAHVRRFCSQNPLRQHFMLDLNIGPDLMIYLLSLLGHSGAVPVAVSVVAQFSTHPASMTVRYGSSQLKVGYWLAKIWAFEYLCQNTRQREAAICASSVVLVGTRMLAARLIRFETRWLRAIIREIVGVLLRAIRNQMLLRTIRECYLHIFEWMRTRTRQLIPI